MTSIGWDGSLESMELDFLSLVGPALFGEGETDDDWAASILLLRSELAAAADIDSEQTRYITQIRF